MPKLCCICKDYTQNPANLSTKRTFRKYACRLADDKFDGARMRQRENRRVYARKFQNEITHAMHAGQERSV